MAFKVLHINTERGWRGGENQMRLFIERSPQNEVENHLAALAGEGAAKNLKASCPVLELPVKTSVFKTARLIAEYCIAQNIQLLDAQSSKAHTIALLVKRKLPHLKLIVHRRVDNHPGRDWLNQWKYRTTLVDQYVAISKAIKTILIDHGISEARIAVVPSAVDASPYATIDRQSEKTALASAFSLDSTQVFIGNASALSRQKGYDTLIRAMRILKDEDIRLHCFIAGDGELRGELEALRQELRLDQDVTFLGFITEVATFLSSLDILTVPSNNEGLGTIILEGIHAGCVIVGSNVGGIPEMVIHQETGLLMETGNAEQLASHLKVLVADQEMRTRLNQSAKDHIDRNFSIDAMVKGNLAIIQRLVE